MKERPILFSAPMVRAILEGRKTVTRRVVKPQPELLTVSNDVPFGKAGHRSNVGWWWRGEQLAQIGKEGFLARCPYGQPGDRLWVRETWGVHDQGFDTAEESHFVVYRADADRPEPLRWRPSIHMYRADSRITLEVTGVRVERLWDITTEQAIAEGLEGTRPSNLCEMAWRDYAMSKHDPFEWFGRPVDSFHSLWVSINGIESWDANPWVWAVEFKRVLP